MTTMTSSAMTSIGLLVILLAACGNGPVDDRNHVTHECELQFNEQWSIPHFTVDHSDSRSCADFVYTYGDPVSTAATVYENNVVFPHQADAISLTITPCDVYWHAGWACPFGQELATPQETFFSWEIENFDWVYRAHAWVDYNAGSTTPDWVEHRLWVFGVFPDPVALLKIPFAGVNQT